MVEIYYYQEWLLVNHFVVYVPVASINSLNFVLNPKIHQNPNPNPKQSQSQTQSQRQKHRAVIKTTIMVQRADHTRPDQKLQAQVVKNRKILAI